jgi:hypothetical protein
VRAIRPLTLLALLAIGVGACVAERTEPGLRYQGRPVGSRAEQVPPTLPSGPVASPVLDSTFSSVVDVEVVPLGGVPYDGQVLPLTSPDGRFLATQEGQPPSWPTLLALPGASVPLSTRITVYDIGQRPARTIGFAVALPRGLLLGRACDEQGFLVEAPQPDGARWIGRISWVSGKVDWLVRDGRVNAHAVLTPSGSLAYIARDIGAEQAAMVLLAPDGNKSERAGNNGVPLFPLAAPEPGILCCIAGTDAGLEVQAWSLSDAPERLGSVVARALICPGGDAALAYQVVAPAAPVRPRRSGEPWTGERPVVFHPSFGRMAEFDRNAGGLVLLPQHSVAASRAEDAGAPGWFVTTPEGLIFSPDSAREPLEPGQRRTVKNPRILAGPYVPRRTTDPNRPLVLLGPMPRDPNRLQVMALRFVGPERAEPAVEQ